MLQKAKKIAESCPCGRKHDLTTSVIECRPGATDDLIDYIRDRYIPERALLAADENTAKYADRIVARLGCRMYILPGDAHANEISTAMLDGSIKESGAPDVMIACGSGSVHDIVRYCAHGIGADFVSYPTAASVDGFVSGVAAMTMHGQKLTYPSSSPKALFAEPEVFRCAPPRLTASGVGDLIGKITALFDWKVAHILTGEPLCPEIYGAMNEALEGVIKACGECGAADPTDLPVLVMNGLLLSGLAMQLAGNSRPASGSEHHMSHFWEMHVANEPTDALHGEKVGVGTVLMLLHIKANADLLYKRLVTDERIIFSRNVILNVYGQLTDGILKENLPSGEGSSAISGLGEDALIKNADSLRALIDSLPSAEDTAALLTRVGAPVELRDIALPDDDAFVCRSLDFSPYVRNRLTFAKIISAVKITEEATNQ